MLKPINKAELFSELDECFENMEKPVRRLIIKTIDGTISLPLNEAVKYSDHRLIYHLHGRRRVEGLYQKRSFEKQAAAFLESGLFVKVSASYFVNMENIKLITASVFLMTDETEYKITRKYSDAKKTYINFVMKNGNGGMPE